MINLSGQVFLEAARSPFAEADALLADLRGKADAVLVDMHAEVTSEKVAMGWYLDGRVMACVGTHTHVPTADARVLPGGTAYITDVGMTGPRGGVIGVKKEQAIERFLTLTQVRFETATEDPWLNAVLVEARLGGARHVDSPAAGAGGAGQRPKLATSTNGSEPDHVEVEPVVHGQLERDQHRRPQGGDLAVARPPRHERHQQRQPDAAAFTRSGASAARSPGPRC